MENQLEGFRRQETYTVKARVKGRRFKRQTKREARRPPVLRVETLELRPVAG